MSTKCSRVLGPANVPSLVTWPIIIAVMPFFLQYERSSSVQNLTCAVDPGALGIAFVPITWIESIIANLGFSASRVERIVSRLDSLAISMFGLDVPSRFARSWIWYSDSSPEIIKVLRSCWAILCAIWRVSVDFPIPGSPVRRVKDEFKKPPPNVWSSSLMFVRIRFCFSGEKLLRGVTLAGFSRIPVGRAGCFTVIFSSKVLHSSH